MKNSCIFQVIQYYLIINKNERNVNNLIFCVDNPIFKFHTEELALETDKKFLFQVHAEEEADSDEELQNKYLKNLSLLFRFEQN